ncbi:hypothetical protein FRC09_018091 [Ceratobasidium sp. 395]|nr:hypothetical protein FRC09_018091 [Ceratobasidium sp. 395]
MLRSTSKALAGSRSNGSYHVLRTVGLLYTTCHRRNYHVNKAEHLKDLNSAQLRAVTFPPNTSLQILAGPGTGKTRVLTSRVVELIRKHNLPPSSIHAVTFTRKAAFEMRDRLERHLGSGITDQIGVGTFHSICTRYLKEYGAYVNLPQDFLIWDEDQCVLLVWYLAQRYQPNITLKAAAEINRNLASAKAFLGDSPREVFLDRCSWDTRDWMGKLFDDYQKALKASNALDFEDLQRICFDLYNKVPWIKRLSDLRHVLVDEFQDTSSRQYLLIQKLFRASKGCVTVVGDPDQSCKSNLAVGRKRHICNQCSKRYRSHELEEDAASFKHSDLPGTHEILLEENYRSTASILAASHAIIKQAEESEFIASEVKRLVKTSNGLFTYGDFAILNIDNYPSPELQRAFKAEGIPIRILPEPSIWDVPEVNILLAHLHVAMNTGNTPMLCRALNGPYGFDKEAIANLTARGIDENQLPFDVLEKICNGDASDIIPAIKQKGHPFVRVVRSLETLISEGLSPAKLLQYIRTAVNYDDFLDRRSPKWSYLHKQNVDSFIVYAKKCTKNVK